MRDTDVGSSQEPLIVVSNRLPVTVVRRESGLSYKPSAGGHGSSGLFPRTDD